MSTSFSSKTGTLSKDKGFLYLLLAGIITVVLWNIPYGDYVLYPFSILGTWFHEMGHGLMAILMGGKFIKLEIFSNGSGVAYHSHTSLWLGERIGGSLISLGGLMGPPIVGSLLILAGRKPKSSSRALNILALLMVLSIVIWIRSIAGILVITALAAAAVFIAQKGSQNVKQFAIQFLGVQAAMSTYRQLDYLFMEHASMGLSDTGTIAEHLFLPYWFWGGLVAVFSAYMLGWSLWESLSVTYPCLGPVPPATKPSPNPINPTNAK